MFAENCAIREGQFEIYNCRGGYTVDDVETMNTYLTFRTGGSIANELSEILSTHFDYI